MKTKLILFITVLFFQFGFSQEPVRVTSTAIDSVKTESLELEKEAKANEKAERDRLKAEKDKTEITADLLVKILTR